MEIKFSLTKQEYWKYNKYSVFNIWAITRIFIITPIVAFTLCVVAGFVFKEYMWLALLVGFAIVLIYSGIVFIPMYQGLMKIAPSQLTEQTLNINFDKKQIIRTLNDKAQKYNRENVYKMKQVKNYIFITMTSYSALIIPKSDKYDLNEVYQALEKII